MPSAAAIRSAVARLSPVSITGRMPRSLERCDRVASRSRAARRRSRSAPAARPSMRDVHDRPALARRAPRDGRPRPSSAMCSRSSRRALPIASRLALDRGERPVARHGLETTRLAADRARVASAALTIASASGCSLSRSSAAASRSSVVLVDAVGGHDRDDLGLAAGQRARSCRGRRCRAWRPARARSHS